MKLSEITFPLLIVFVIVLYGSQALMGDFSQAYNQKVSIAPALIQGDLGSEESIKDATIQKTYIVSAIELLGTSIKGSDSATKRVIAYSFGETDLRYHFKLKSGDFVPTTLDLSTNFLYNYSYIINTPSKLAHNIKADFTLGDTKLVNNDLFNTIFPPAYIGTELFALPHVATADIIFLAPVLLCR